MNEIIFKNVADQMMKSGTVEIDGKNIAVRRSTSQRLKMVAFMVDGNAFTAIEQSPDKPSRWGQLAREGHSVVQIKDVKSNRFVSVVVDGEVKNYK
jgi:hypothetical protein